ncbi:MAG: cellulase family glycosylhydrolase [Chitinophagaceae bacterium]|nr:cellulase family glycosylhydrolase [Chitinophagaceae bacterium]
MKKLFILLFVTASFINCRKKQTQNIQNPVETGFIFTIPTLSKGVNLSNWFNDYSDPSQYNTRFTASSFQQIKSAGFTYVRVPIGNSILYNGANPSQLNTVHLQKVDAGIQSAINAGLG